MWKFAQKCTKFENILKNGRWLYAIIIPNKLLEQALFCQYLLIKNIEFHEWNHWARSVLVKYSILLLIKDMGLDDSWAEIGTVLILLLSRNWKLVRGELHIYFCKQCVIMTLGVRGVITNDVLKFRKIIEFQN